MSNIQNRIGAELKQAMLAKNQKLVSTLRLIKSAVHYRAIEAGSKEALSDEQVISVLRKESKRRGEAAEMYRASGVYDRAQHEQDEKQIIDKYLPAALDEAKVRELVDLAIAKIGPVEAGNMGKIIGKVKAASGGLADGAMIAAIVKGKMNR